MICAGLHALGLHDRDDRHGQVRRVGEDQVDVGVHQDLVLEHLAGIGRRSHCIAALLMISTSGASLAITSSKPFWMSSV